MKTFDKLNNRIITLLAVVGMMTSCSDEIINGLINGELPINIGGQYPATTRATDNAFVQDDAVGIFIVDYDRDGNAQELSIQGNRADNLQYTFDGAQWKANRQLFWADKQTPADFYGYYPYNASLISATDYTFSVYTNQENITGGKSNYEQSDLLWAKAEKVQPTAESINLQYHHLMAGVAVQLQMGTGFTSSEWAQLKKIVQVENVVVNATVNLQTGKVVANGSERKTLTPYIYNNVWRAVVVPQTIAKGKTVLSITVDGKTYQLVKDEAVEYISGKMHNFAVTVNKNSSTGEYTFELSADDIVAWVDDADMHDGLVRQYVIVEVSEAGTLSEVLAARGYDIDKVDALKIIGNINHCDMEFMGQEMKNLARLNLAKVTLCADEHLEAGVLTGFYEHQTLRSIVFPETGLKIIAESAFYNSGLTGSLTLPEGLIEIGGNAFSTWEISSVLYGTLSLPSTLKSIGDGAFRYQSLNGELLLPEGLEYMGSVDGISPFHHNSFSGSLNLPSTIKSMALPSGNFTGTITVPSGVTEFSADRRDGWSFNFHIDNGILELHDDIEYLNVRDCGFVGELVLPKALKTLTKKALSGTKFSKIIMTDNLKVMEAEAMANNPYLTSVVLSENLINIPYRCFYGCSALHEITIPANVDLIGEKAFFGCAALGSIVCEGTEPPVVADDAFYAVSKDNFTLEVPKGCLQKYREADGWKEFKRISEKSSFVCRPSTVNALNNSHSENIIINADGDWSVTSKPEWVQMSKTSGTGKNAIVLTTEVLAHGHGKREGRITFKMGDTETFCDVTQYDYEHEEDSYITLQKHTEGNGIDVVFMGDGWTGAEISDGSYLSLVKEQMEYFFGVEPLKSHRDYFNVHVAFPLSQENGVNTMNTYVNNRFGTLYGYFDVITSNQLITETDEVLQYATDKTPLTRDNLSRSLVILVPNSDNYEGVTYYSDTSYGTGTVSLCPPSSRPYPQDNRGVVQHEACGHGFGKLGDEGIKKMAWISPKIAEEIDKYHSRGWYQNLSLTSKMSDVSWRDFIFDTRYSDQVDVFEGGYGFMRGVFRSENNSCMNYGIPYFNAISRLEIMKRIRDYSGTGFNMDYFYAHDTNKWGDTDGHTRSGAAHAYLSGNSITGSNTHRAPMRINPKKMGNSVRAIREKIKNTNR